MNNYSIFHDKKIISCRIIKQKNIHTGKVVEIIRKKNFSKEKKKRHRHREERGRERNSYLSKREKKRQREVKERKVY